MKKLLTVIFVSLLLCVNVPIQAEESTTVTLNVDVVNKPENRTFGADLTNITMYLDYRWLTVDCAGYYNNQLATFASLLSCDIYDTVYVAETGTTPSYTDEETGVLQTALGLDDYQYFEIVDYNNDKLDTTSLGIAHKVVTIENEKYNVFFATISGTRNEDEWRSNVDTGNVNEFGNLHPDWLVKENHKGFDVAATRTKKAIDKYISVNSVSDARNTMLITGHSRGGAIASILGTYYEKDNSIDSYTYTFSSPMNTLVSNTEAKSYKTIFNLANQDDFITTIPLTSWGFTRYGRDITISADLKDSFVSLATTYLGFDYVSPDTASLDESFELITTERDDLYADCYMTTSIENKEDITEFIDISAAGDYWSIFEEDETNITYKYNKQYLLNTLSIIIANRDLGFGLFTYLIGLAGLMQYTGQFDLLNTLIQVLTEDASKIGTPHYCACSYAMAQTIPSETKTQDNKEVRGAYASTYLYSGYTGDTYCVDCNKLLEVGKQIPALGQVGLKDVNIELDYYYSEYTGNNKKPNVTLTYNGEIIPSEYYTVSYENNKEVGTATVIVKANEEDIPYKGNIKVNFFITEKEIIEEVKENKEEENEQIQETEIKEEKPKNQEDTNIDEDYSTKPINSLVYIVVGGIVILIGLVIVLLNRK